MTEDDSRAPHVEDAARDGGSADLSSAALRAAHTLLAGLAGIANIGCGCCADGGHGSFLAELDFLFADAGGDRTNAAAAIGAVANFVRAIDRVCTDLCSAHVAWRPRNNDSVSAAAEAFPLSLIHI